VRRQRRTLSSSMTSGRGGEVRVVAAEDVFSAAAAP
jgi:hypothetical protein